MKKKGFIIGGLVAMIAIVIAIIMMVNKPYVSLVDSEVDVNVGGSLNPTMFIEDTNGCDVEDVQVINNVDMNKIGDYDLVYKVKDKEYKLIVHVKDMEPPVFDIKGEYQLVLGGSLKAEELVSDIKDYSKTTVRFKEDYVFDKEGKVDVEVVVEDEYGNQSYKESKIEIVKDVKKPTLNKMEDLVVVVNQKVPYMSNVIAKDDLDPNPQVKVDSSNVNINKVGTYEVIYTVVDHSGNENVYKRKVIVKDKAVISKPQAIVPSGEKIVYLTFDDGPSLNTKKVLDILDRYNAKATFFVTGNGQKYNYLIKEAHDRGHTIGLHTYSHDYKKVYSSVDHYFNDLNMIGQMVKDQIGFVPKYIRFPGGSSNAVSKRYCKGIMTVLTKEVQNRGYQYYDWNVSSADASGNKPPVSKIVKASTSSKASNIMLLMHDTQAKTTTVEALPQIIEHYQALGYSFKGVNDTSYTPHHGVNN